MRRLSGLNRLNRYRAVVALVVAAAALSCGDDPAGTPTGPTPTTPRTTETFSGTLSANGAHTYPFISGSGTLTLTLTTVTPDTVALGISLGTWSGTSCTVGTGLFNDAATKGAAISGQLTSTGSLCARVYDGAGQITAPTTYTITVVHP